MTEPPTYLRIPHLVAGRGTRDDVVIGAAERDALLARPVVVEEKLDGANVVLWLDDGRVECALRSGVGGADRAGQLGPLRAWVAERTDALRVLLADVVGLYGEWLLLTHTIRYDRLPAYLIALDLLEATGSFATVDERNRRCAKAGLHCPPELWRGTPSSLCIVEALLAQSQLGSEPAEGLVLRSTDGREPRIAKLVRPRFEAIDDSEWAHGRPHNVLADREASWR